METLIHQKLAINYHGQGHKFLLTILPLILGMCKPGAYFFYSTGCSLVLALQPEKAVAPCMFGEDLQAGGREKQQVLLVSRRGMGHLLRAEICFV